MEKFPRPKAEDNNESSSNEREDIESTRKAALENLGNAQRAWNDAKIALTRDPKNPELQIAERSAASTYEAIKQSRDAHLQISEEKLRELAD